MWAQQTRFVEDMHVFVDEVVALGYDAIEISHLTPQEPFDRLLARHGVVISSIHAPAPLVRDATERANSSLNLASTDDDERKMAIAFTKGSIDYTKRVGGRYVVVHLGGVGSVLAEDMLQGMQLLHAIDAKLLPREADPARCRIHCRGLSARRCRSARAGGVSRRAGPLA